MRKSSSPEALRTFWLPRFPGQIPDDNPVADPLDGEFFELEGRPLVPVSVRHTDTDDTTVLHVPDLALVVAGDAVYNDVHQYLAESDAQGRRDWLAALDTIEGLGPRAVVAGHKRYGKDDAPRTIDETRQYIPRLRPARQGNLYRRGTVLADAGDLPAPRQPRRTVALGAVGKGLNQRRITGR
jgi:Metallo-beta-lactamase superfamily